MTEPILSINTYRAFVLYYVSQIDSNDIEEEMEYLADRLGADPLKNARKLADDMSDFECLRFIEEQREKFYPGDDGKWKLLNEIRELFQSDGEFSDFEKVLMHNLERLL